MVEEVSLVNKAGQVDLFTGMKLSVGIHPGDKCVVARIDMNVTL